LDHPNEQSRGSFGIHIAVYFARTLALFDERLQLLDILPHELTDHALGKGIFGALKFAKYDSRHSGVSHMGLDVRHEYGLQSLNRRLRRTRRFFHPREHALGHPLYDRLPNRVFGGKMPEQGTLRNMHLFGNGAGCDFGRILDSGQIEYGLHRGLAALSRRKTCA